jgi:hypothetical protein
MAGSLKSMTGSLKSRTGSLKSRTSSQHLLGGAKELVEEGWDEGGVMLRRRNSSSKDLGVRDPALGARRDPALGARERRRGGGGGGGRRRRSSSRPPFRYTSSAVEALVVTLY